MTGIMGIAVSVLLLAGGQTQPGDRAGERPRGGADSTVEQLRQELAGCRAECELLKTENARLRTERLGEAAAMLADCVEAIAQRSYSDAPASTVRLMCVFDAGLEGWAKDTSDRELLVEPCRKALKAFFDRAKKDARRRFDEGVATGDPQLDQAAEMLRSLFEWMGEGARGEDAELAGRIFRALNSAMSEWAGVDEQRVGLTVPSRGYFAEYAKGLKRSRRSAPREEGPLPIERSPGRLRAELDEVDRAKIAEIVAGYAGREVVWRGKVTDFAGARLQLVCDGVIVEMAVEKGGKGLKVGDTAAVRGWIADITGNAWVGVEVTLKRASVVPDQHGSAEPPPLPR